MTTTTINGTDYTINDAGAGSLSVYTSDGQYQCDAYFGDGDCDIEGFVLDAKPIKMTDIPQHVLDAFYSVGKQAAKKAMQELHKS